LKGETADKRLPLGSVANKERVRMPIRSFKMWERPVGKGIRPRYLHLSHFQVGPLRAFILLNLPKHALKYGWI
jgi:hypothetical protein